MELKCLNKSFIQKLQKPIAAPLQKLFLARCRLTKLPDFGILPELVQLNVSFNLFNEITPQQFSPLCKLSKLDIKNCTKINPCMCKTLTDYFNRRNIFIIDYFGCPRVHEGENQIFTYIHTFIIFIDLKKIIAFSIN